MPPLPSKGGVWVSPTDVDGMAHGKGKPPEEVIMMLEKHVSIAS